MSERPVIVSSFWLLILVAFPAMTGLTFAETVSTCIECHSTLDDSAPGSPTHNIDQDVHLQRGLSCHSCHGGNPEAGFDDYSQAHSEEYDWRGVPAETEIPEFCARCHADVEYMKQYNPKLPVDQLLEYRSSHHGKLLEQGDTRVAQCVSCHGVHGMLPVEDTRSPVHATNVANTCAQCHADEEYMAGYGIPTDQHEEYLQSIHGVLLLEDGELAAPSCNDCHGNHASAPPGVTSIANACGECHAKSRDLFRQSPHQPAFAEMEVGQCDFCHGHHDVEQTSDAMLGVGDEAICTACHGEGDAGYAAARTMRSMIDSLALRIDQAQQLLERASQGGVDVQAGKFDLQKPKSSLIKARAAIHAFDPQEIEEITQSGMQQAALVIEFGKEAMHSLKMRSVGLAFSIPLILLVALGLYLKIRKIERKPKSTP